MKTGFWNKTAVWLIGLVLLCSLTTGCGYNQIQSMDEEINNKWAQVENQLQRRNDLIPNLVKVVKSYAAHEEKVYIEVAQARASMGGALQSNDPQKVAQAEGAMTGALSRLIAVAENYPNIKANEQYTRLMDELAGTENRVAVARMDYNDAVRNYNSYIRQFPQALTAKAVGAKPRVYYNPPASETQKLDINM